jgi:hypothetical protein
MGFLEALQDPKISEIVLLGDVVLDPRGSGERDPILITRNVTITSPPGTPRSSLPALDFSFQQDEATIGVNVTVTFKSVMLKNMRCASGCVGDCCCAPARGATCRARRRTAGVYLRPLRARPQRRWTAGLQCWRPPIPQHAP